MEDNKPILKTSNIPIYWLIVSAIFGAGVTYTTIQFQNKITGLEVKRLEQELDQIHEFILDKEKISNDEDDGVRSDFEVADKHLKEYIDLKISKHH